MRQLTLPSGQNAATLIFSGNFAALCPILQHDGPISGVCKTAIS
jgi:hypothetical protein